MQWKKRVSALVVTSLMVTGLIAAAPPAQASFHLMKVVEVFVGGQNDNSQYVVLQMYSSAQTQVQNQDIDVFNSQGTKVDTFSFEDPVATGTDQSRILAATNQAQNFFGVTADMTIAPSMSATGGKACFETIDCVTWGNYSGPAPVGTPADPDGFNTRRAIRRDLGPNGTLGANDDTNDSAADFEVKPTTPINNNGQAGTLAICFLLRRTSIGVSEAAGTANVLIEGEMANAEIDYETNVDSATPNDDYNPAGGTVISNDGTPDANAQIAIPIVDDDDEEQSESFEVEISNARQGVTPVDICFTPSVTVTIEDDDTLPPPDETAPESTITKPGHNKTYAKSKLTKLKGTANDGGGSGVVGVEFKLRKKMTNGGCKFWNGGEFSTAPCNTELALAAQGTTVWTHTLAKKLSPSIGTKTKNYTLFASATDAEINIESVFEEGRNKNTFEIKPD